MSGPTLVFCSCFASDLATWEIRYRRWIDAVERSKVHYTQILIVDDGSPCRPDWPDVVFVPEGEPIPRDAAIVIYHFAQRLGRIGTRNYPGWYRSFCFAGTYASELGAEKVIHLESDAFLISWRIQNAFNDFKEGWASVYLVRYKMPESAIQVVAGAGIRKLAEFCSVPYEKRVEKDIENLIPFDYIFAGFTGSRYGETQDYIPYHADWAVQVFPPLRNDKNYFWWLKPSLSAPGEVKSSMPRIVALSMVKNEQDIIEPFVRHTSMFVDHHVILDNGSVDETRRILTDLMREIDGVIVTTSSEFGYTQSERMSKLLRACQTGFFADYVIFLDADEFISCESRSEFETVLSSIPYGGYGRIPWRTYVLTPNGTTQEQQDPPRSMPWRRTTEQERPNVVLRLDGKHWHDLVIAQGNHEVMSTTGRQIPCVDVQGLHLKHFPLRSTKQFLAKCIVGWMAYLAKDPDAARKGDGYHWLKHYRIVTGGGNITYEMLCDLSMLYDQPVREYRWSEDVVLDSPPDQYERHYSSGEYADPLGLVAKSWQATLEVRQPLLTITRKAIAADPAMQSTGATAFDAEWHWDHPFADVPPFNYLVEKYQPKSALDVGCGLGAYVSLFKNLGVKDVFGIDGLSNSATILDEAEYREVDLSQPLVLGRKFDIVLCLEVAEHLPNTAAQNILGTLRDHAQGLIIFSAAEPGQPGHGHVNNLPVEQWLRRWQSLGWIPDLEETLAMRAISTLPWFKRNIVVLRPAGDGDGEAVIRELARIGALPYTWHHCNPGIRAEVLSEDTPLPPAGYSSGASEGPEHRRRD